mmetsp:Transcript_95981/g.311314  ORF Transcript_95981/g.311314 Transcript_95981/m.311314 type:complete len:255 (-) Transcript_95981:3-767(-)|eukprot:CAMPEP_0204200782 /NCGR_PEP_ID=MMETSP0361-20130328/66990_1 /ASSEMBLY_ACC=CAM_ASM_000343 /TAXON_ID=268821 /ORGANISM="Scrippsiella Hangoei, Strain SHTV-5" /LENGTH=254 /DNA_ID=CAMNT_0051163295 /DNA_START=85 /DNA_END=849 /DNA_ORIENTATION=+
MGVGGGGGSSSLCCGAGCFAGLAGLAGRRPDTSSASSSSAGVAAADTSDVGVVPSKESVPRWQPRGPPDDAAAEPLLSATAKIAARKDDPESIDLIVTLLKQSIKGLDEKGRTLLFYTVRGTRDDGGSLEPAGGSMASPVTPSFAPGCRSGGAARHLVESMDFDVNFQVHDSGLSPLMEAARYGNLDAVRVLLELRADCTLCDSQGLSVLDIARRQLPDYLSVEEASCSENRWEGVKAQIQCDRGLIAQLLELV